MSQPALNFLFDFPEPPVPSEDPADLSCHEAWFSAYTALEKGVCPHDPAPMELKFEHTFKVYENAKSICQGEGMSPVDARIPLLAALYHDVGRFPQYRVWKTFKDKLSMNHGQLGTLVLDKGNTLAHEPGKEAVREAVFFHNAFSVPDTLLPAGALAVRVVRDSDKLDIVRVIDEHLAKDGPYSPTVILSLPDDPGLFSQTVVENTQARRISSYGDLTSVNDFRMLLCSWVWDMNFPTSRRLFALSPHVERLLDSLPEAIYGRARDEVRKSLHEIREEGGRCGKIREV